ncbi:MAG: F0F1 ATP synthase subunit epsilon [Thermodesulfovibrionales bacterium]|nr:F0F1 ATP synthase subunit epsilon [Thermodesulfovibrionales bacterium]
MTNKLQLDIVTPYGQVLSEEVDEVSAQGTEGDFGVLAGHVPFVTTLKIGILSYRKGNVTEYVFVNSGYAEVTAEKVVIMADSAEKAADIDIERAKASLKRAEERLKRAEEIDYARAMASLERATIRIQLAQRR